MLIAVVVLRRAGEFAIACRRAKRCSTCLGRSKVSGQKLHGHRRLPRRRHREQLALSWLKSVGFGIVGVSLLAAPLAAVWAVIGALLGQPHKRLHEKKRALARNPNKLLCGVRKRHNGGVILQNRRISPSAAIFCHKAKLQVGLFGDKLGRNPIQLGVDEDQSRAAPS